MNQSITTSTQTTTSFGKSQTKNLVVICQQQPSSSSSSKPTTESIVAKTTSTTTTILPQNLIHHHRQLISNNNNLIIGTTTTTTSTTAAMVKPRKEKTKRKNSEKRKEKSRKAARERRSQEAKIFDEIEEILPVPSKILDHLDKASLVRIAINFLKIRSVVDPFQVPTAIDSFDLVESSILNTLNGFMFVLSKDGDLIYLSENVERFLGLNQIDLMGQSIYDYSHPCDHDDIKSFLEPLHNAFNASKSSSSSVSSASTSLILSASSIAAASPASTQSPQPQPSSVSPSKTSTTMKTNNQSIPLPSSASSSSSSSASSLAQSKTQLAMTNSKIKNNNKNENNKQKLLNKENSCKNNLHHRMLATFGPYFLRMKCTLTNKGRNLNLKSANYKVIKCRGKMVDLEILNPTQAKMIGENYRHYMIVVGEIIPHPIRLEIPLRNNCLVFVSKHTPDMKFSYVDESVKELFGYEVNDLIGTSFYQYFDANDFTQLSVLFKTLFAKGQCDFGQYKFLAKTGGYRWISTQATIINEPNSSQPQSIILIHRVISNIQDAHLLTSDVQSGTITSNTTTATTTSTTTVNNNIVENSNLLTPPGSSNNNNDNSYLIVANSAPTLLSFNPSAVGITSSVIKAKPPQTQQQLDIPIPELSSNVDEPVPNLNQKSTFKVKEETEVSEELLIPRSNSSSICKPSSITDQFISSTETVLAPKTADMESGFLVFTEDNKSLTVSSDAYDLTHLAPDAGDLSVPMLPDMDFADMNFLDEIFPNSSPYNITASGVLSEDEFLNNLASLDGNDKLKLDSFDNFNLEFDNQMKKFPNENFLGINNKDLKSSSSSSSSSNAFDQDQYLSSDPFLSFSNANHNDEFLITDSPTTRSDCSINESFTSINSPINSSSSNSLQYSPKSIPCDESISSKLCDSDDNKDLEMKAPFIPIDDDYLLSDLSYSNLDDLFDLITNNNDHHHHPHSYHHLHQQQLQSQQQYGGNNNKTIINGEYHPHHQQQQPNEKINNSSKNKCSIPNLKGGCLEALLQNDELICNLKNKMYSSNQILSREQQQQQMLDSNNPGTTSLQQQQNNNKTDSNNNKNSNNNMQFSSIIIENNTNSSNNNNSSCNNNNPNGTKTSTSMKRKNSNIFVYTTMSQTGEKKIKNLIFTPDISPVTTKTISNADNGTPAASIHHFVLTENNELIPKVTFVQQQQQQQLFKVPKRMMLAAQPMEQLPSLMSTGALGGTLENSHNNTNNNNNNCSNNNNSNNSQQELIKENVFKKPRSETIKSFSSNSVLLNLLVNGSDLTNGYELTHPSSFNNNNHNNGNTNNTNNNNNNNKIHQIHSHHQTHHQINQKAEIFMISNCLPTAVPNQPQQQQQQQPSGIMDSL